MKLEINENLSHFNMCKVVLGDSWVFKFSYRNIEYYLDFSDVRVKKNHGYLVCRIDGEAVEYDLLMWLTLYFGESATDPYAVTNSTCSFVRGDLYFKYEDFIKYIKKVEVRPLKSNSKWKNNYIHKALANYCLGVQMADLYMPYTIGLFALSIECLANAALDVRGKYSTLGNKGYKKIINKAFKYKNNDPERRAIIKANIKFIDQEIDVISHVRNAFYGHGLIYDVEHRRKLSLCLSEWMVKHGFERKRGKRKWFRDELLERSLEVSKFSMFKLAQNVSRLLFGYYLGVSDKMPFTEYDFQFRNAPWDVIEYGHPERVS
ncbi:hypothetical protein [Pseudomonas orientalis]|uniref:Uncharacterized protein n=1 Tax=Pseudomonas orientalis TaxID=76758 RepID=A0A2L0RS42_9PSED|nr:hypothetical protein [Pseudomonas orientalis]AUZ44957.1 hypothetical protein BOP93_04955 [Pseudomonas orientalis]